MDSTSERGTHLQRSPWIVALIALALGVLEADVAGAAPDAALQAASARAARAAGAPIAVSPKRGTGLASFVRRVDGGDLNPALGRRAPADKARDFLTRHGDLFGLRDAATDTAPLGERTDPLGWTHVEWQQVHGGLEVFGAKLRAHVAPDGTLRAVNGATVAIVGPLATTPTVPGEEAERIAAVGARGVPTAVVGRRLVVYAQNLLHGVDDEARLAYAIELETLASGQRDLVMVDALDGRVLDRIRLTPDALVRQVAQSSLDNVVWSEGDPDPVPASWSGGSAAQTSAWQNEIDGARESYAFHGSLSLGTRLSFDGADAIMQTLHDPPGIGCPNANWNGSSTNYCPGVTSDDVVSHEWGHAYTQFTSNLVYAWQPGALNESYSDVWGESVDLLNGRQTDAPGAPRTSNGSTCSSFGSFDGAFPATDASYRWLMGEDATGFGTAIRDMWHPECRFDPGRVGSERYFCDATDGGGVHTNSGVPNHLYALLVDGGVYNSTTVAGLGLTKAANILWRATSVYETPVTDFSDHADAVEQSCADLIGAPLGKPVTTPPATWTTAPETITAADCAAVAAATAAVELRNDPPCVATPILQPNPPALCNGLGTFESLSVSDFESTLAPWTAGTRAVASPATYDGGTWLRTTSLPDGRPGAGAFTADPILGDCGLDDESGVSFLESPPFVVPIDRSTLHLAFEHWIATEQNYDGGNVKVSVNGGPFVLVPSARFAFNAYNQSLRITGNTDPLAGEEAWSGTDGGSLSGSWGESQLDLTDLAEPGDTVRLRFELGMDGCNGITGWYLDDVRVYTCSAEIPLCPPEPIPGCHQAPLGHAKLAVKDDVADSRDRLQWSWSKGSATTLADLGNPLATARYGLCIWDGRSGAPTLVASAAVAPGFGWKTNGTTTVSYTDSHGTAHGVSRIKVRAGTDGKASVSFQAKGAALDLPTAASAVTRFEANPPVTVQLVTSTGTCWESRFGAADFRPNTLAKAKATHKGP